MSDNLPLIIDLYFGDTTLLASLRKGTKDDASLPWWALKVFMISETFVIQPLPWNDRKSYNDICLSNRKFAVNVLNFLTAQKDFKNLPILEIGSGDGLLSMFLKKKGFKGKQKLHNNQLVSGDGGAELQNIKVPGVVTSDFENADSMYTLKWNHERNGVYHKHIPYNWGKRFPKGELTEYWQQMVSLTLPDPHKYSPYIDMPSQIHIFLANDVLGNAEYHPVFNNLLQQLFTFVAQDLQGVPLLLLGLSEKPTGLELKFLTSLDSQGHTVDPLGKQHNAYLIGLKSKNLK